MLGEGAREVIVLEDIRLRTYSKGGELAQW